LSKYFFIIFKSCVDKSGYNIFYFTFCFYFRIELNYNFRKLLQVREKNFLFHFMFCDLLLVHLVFRSAEKMRLLLEPLGINRTQDDYCGVRVSKKKGSWSQSKHLSKKSRCWSSRRCKASPSRRWRTLIIQTSRVVISFN
jgi:hypothetical protein